MKEALEESDGKVGGGLTHRDVQPAQPALFAEQENEAYFLQKEKKKKKRKKKKKKIKKTNKKTPTKPLCGSMTGRMTRPRLQ